LPLLNVSAGKADILSREHLADIGKRKAYPASRSWSNSTLISFSVPPKPVAAATTLAPLDGRDDFIFHQRIQLF
jgi:hypothetical protein